MSLKCGLKIIFTSIIFLLTVKSYAKDIPGVEKKHRRLNEYISHYETLDYDNEHIKACHNRAKLSVTNDHFVHLKFSAHERDFHLRLKRDLNTFSDKLEIYGSAGPVDVSLEHIYVGKVVGDRNSYVFGSILDGVFEGKIITERDAYYVEHAKRYFPTNRTEPIELSSAAKNKIKSTTSTTTTKAYHSVIYKDAHVDDAYKDVREGHVGGCGITQEISQWMQTIQNSTVEELPEPLSKDANAHSQHLHNNKLCLGDNGTNAYQKNVEMTSGAYSYMDTFYDPESGYRYSPNNADWHQRVHERVRRASGSSDTAGNRDDNRNTCSLYIQTDPLIWRHIREGIADQDGAHQYDIDAKTREEITSLIAHHVTAVNYIYSNTKFEGHAANLNIRFEVQRIKIDDDSVCRNSYYDFSPHNAYCNEHMDVSNFLNLHSLEDHSDFCLAYVFTYRDFTGGTLGLAWVASPYGASGGICEKYKTYTENIGGHFQSTKRSLNTGIITFVNYNSRVPPKVSQLTLAHEIGHNFGSPHDYPQQCRPGGFKGNYIMFASATSGDRPNNSKFSPCSVRNISNVLDMIVGIQKRDCFQASEGAFCGNKIVEAGEECDCGYNKEECTDICCYPRIINEYELSLNSSAKGCARRAQTQCSPSQGPCCLTNSCTFMPTNYFYKCKEASECSWASTCNGTTAECPEPKPRDDKTKCNQGTALCIRGDCAGSICLLWNMSECFLTSQVVPHNDKRKLCELACQSGNDPSTCRSTSEFAHRYGLPAGGISLRPGSPCDNFQGYCDVFLKCRAVDGDGPLLRLKNMLLNRKTLLTVAQWVAENWYLVVLMGVGFIIVLGAFVKCCAVHTPSSNPKMRKARRIGETLRAPMNTLRRMRSPNGRTVVARSIPPPVHNSRSQQYRSRSSELDYRGDQSRVHSNAPAVVENSLVALPTGGSHVNYGSHANRSGVGRPLPKTGRGGRSQSVAVEESDSHRSSSRRGKTRVEPSLPGSSRAAVRPQMPLPLPAQQALQQQRGRFSQQSSLRLGTDAGHSNLPKDCYNPETRIHSLQQPQRGHRRKKGVIRQQNTTANTAYQVSPL